MEMDGKLRLRLQDVYGNPLREKVDEQTESVSDIDLSLAKPENPDSEREFPVEVSIHFLPGNHDRLANATPAIRVMHFTGGFPSDPI